MRISVLLAALVVLAALVSCEELTVNVLSTRSIPPGHGTSNGEYEFTFSVVDDKLHLGVFVCSGAVSWRVVNASGEEVYRVPFEDSDEEIHSSEEPDFGSREEVELSGGQWQGQYSLLVSTPISSAAQVEVYFTDSVDEGNWPYPRMPAMAMHRAVHVSEQTVNSLAVSWTASLTDNVTYVLVHHPETDHGEADVHLSACAIEALENVTTVQVINATSYTIDGLHQGTEYHVDVMAVHPDSGKLMAYDGAVGRTLDVIEADHVFEDVVAHGSTFVYELDTQPGALRVSVLACSGMMRWTLMRGEDVLHEFDFGDMDSDDSDDGGHSGHKETLPLFEEESGPGGVLQLHIEAYGEHMSAVEVYWTQTIESWPFPELPDDTSIMVTHVGQNSLGLMWQESTSPDVEYKIIYHAAMHHESHSVHSSACAAESLANKTEIGGLTEGHHVLDGLESGTEYMLDVIAINTANGLEAAYTFVMAATSVPIAADVKLEHSVDAGETGLFGFVVSADALRIQVTACVGAMHWSLHKDGAVVFEYSFDTHDDDQGATFNQTGVPIYEASDPSEANGEYLLTVVAPESNSTDFEVFWTEITSAWPFPVLPEDSTVMLEEVTTTTISIAWHPAAGDVTYKLIYHAVHEGEEHNVHGSACAIEHYAEKTVIPNINALSYELTGLLAGTAYEIDVIAVDGSGSEAESAYEFVRANTNQPLTADTSVYDSVPAASEKKYFFEAAAVQGELKVTVLACTGALNWTLTHRESDQVVFEYEFELPGMDGMGHGSMGMPVYELGGGGRGNYTLTVTTTAEYEANIQIYWTESLALWPFPALPTDTMVSVADRTHDSLTLNWAASPTAGVEYKIIYHAAMHHESHNVHSSACAAEHLMNKVEIVNITGTSYTVTGLNENAAYMLDVLAVNTDTGDESAYTFVMGRTSLELEAGVTRALTLSEQASVAVELDVASDAFRMAVFVCSGDLSWTVQKDGAEVFAMGMDDDANDSPVFEMSSGAAGEYSIAITGGTVEEMSAEVVYVEDLAAWAYPLLPSDASVTMTSVTHNTVKLSWPAPVGSTSGVTYKVVFHAEDAHDADDAHLAACGIEALLDPHTTLVDGIPTNEYLVQSLEPDTDYHFDVIAVRGGKEVSYKGASQHTLPDPGGDTDEDEDEEDPDEEPRDPNSSESKDSTGMVAGVTVGVVALILFVVCAIRILRRSGSAQHVELLDKSNSQRGFITKRDLEAGADFDHDAASDDDVEIEMMDDELDRRSGSVSGSVSDSVSGSGSDTGTASERSDSGSDSDSAHSD